eukprot:CAMPEP_0173387342 /NCGR_PEP_ID=MMETSP1356-20130122/9867_1 /TAXON_ID=77927 ORGANISM="Hemiselmis virescens, Strain PCC157" /NCGR_SAMPLE_ID=MMETSP1356 /ASSEMBLY_ACC=CAM_ASM_000847 /LENGTH=74 /DNA_ID=CAMNT_0014343925 /DNA_START=73 /DNA_END=297 /DNA_ORIENTATION=-
MAGAASAGYVFSPALEAIEKLQPRIQDRSGRLDELQQQWEKGVLTYKEMDEASLRVHAEYRDISNIPHKPKKRE